MSCYHVFEFIQFRLLEQPSNGSPPKKTRACFHSHQQFSAKRLNPYADETVDGESNGLWKRVEPLMPLNSSYARSGRPRMNDRKVTIGMLYVFRIASDETLALPRKWGRVSPCTIASRTERRRIIRGVGAGLRTVE
jgi:hypothetical protein